jgi:hypothetical protein
MLDMTENVSIKISNFAWGSQNIEILFDDEKVNYWAGYCGSDPLGDLIKIAAYFVHNKDDEYNGQYSVNWDGEPGNMNFSVIRDETDKGILHIDVSETGDFTDPETNQPWTQDDKYHFDVPLEVFKDAVVKEAIRVLKDYGVRGYAGSWCDGMDSFPVTSLLVLLGDTTRFDEESDSYRSNIKDELKLLMSAFNED